jgi:two-component system, cell cycle sensor histidine kinase and response regulator CckA
MPKIVKGDASERILERLELLKLQAASPAALRSGQFAEAVTAIQSALHEVEAVEAELAQQNEELLNAREALELERHRYKELFDLAPDGYLVTDARGTIQEANRAASALLGVSERALHGKPLAVCVEPGRRQDLRAMIARLGPGERLQDVEIVFQRPGEPRSRTALVTLAHDEERPGRPARLLWILRDISERRAAEEALRETEERLRHAQRLESIGRLAGGIAHSFNNLLAAIAFHAGLLLEELQGEQRPARHAREIRDAGERAAALARQLLAFGRKQVLQPRLLSLGDVIQNMEPMLRRLLGEHIRLEARLAPDPCIVCVDLGQLEQVILNLVLNARDAMPLGGELTLETAFHELAGPEGPAGEELPPGTYIALSIADTGTGMPPEILGQLFEPFFTTKEREKGSGLGLATVYGIVRQSGGAVRVESEPGQGSRFVILLPRAEAEMEDCAPVLQEERPAAPAPRPDARGGEVVLVVEDEDNIREPAVEILESRGYTVLAARDGQEALELCERHPGPIQLLISDMMMPGMNGDQLARQLTQVRPDMGVVFMSGYPEEAIPHGPAQGNGRSFLQKPFPPDVLLSTVRKLLDERNDDAPS